MGNSSSDSAETDRQKEGYQTKLWREHLIVTPTRR